MDADEARTLLSFHSGNHPDTQDPRGQNGFLGMLRPYRGLREGAFHEVMSCIVALAPALAEEHIDRATVGALWGICHLARAWALQPGGMLQRNELISIDDAQRITAWIDCISYATMMLLEGSDLETAVEPYRALTATRR